jgi:hypothetical protein
VTGRQASAIVLGVGALIGLVLVAPSCATRMRSLDSIHFGYYEVLRKNVIEGKVNYRRLKDTSRPVLDKYLQSLASENPEGPVWQRASRDAKLAFWLNAYNACVISGVVERYPDIESVQDIPGFFDDKRWLVAGEKRSLNEIENEIIRPGFSDPRIHFVLVCAAQSCPPLQPYAVIGTDLQDKLERITREVVNDDRYVRIDPKTKKLRLTRIMSWYGQDFIDKDGSLEAFLLRYLEEPARSQLEQGGYTIEFMEYDWALNDAGAAATR